MNHVRPLIAMDQTAGNRLWVEHWQRLAPILEEIEHGELRALCFERDWERIDSLLQLGFDLPNAKDRHTSGLVEQQRLFGKARQ